MDYIILDLGFDVNILTGKTYESMGKLRLVWSHFQLRLANQSKVLPIGQLIHILIEIEGIPTYAYFKVIEIFNDTNLYPSLLGIYLEKNNQSIIKFKKHILSLKIKK